MMTLNFLLSKIFLHGNNLNSLHQLIHPECLPSEFGGTLPPYDMGTWARTLLGPDYSDENEYTHTSYNAMHVKHASSNLEREASPKPMKRSVLPLKSPPTHWLSEHVWHESSRKGSSDSERGCHLASVDGKEHFTLDCVHGVVGKQKPLCGIIIISLTTVHDNEGKLMSPFTEHYRKYIRVRCSSVRYSVAGSTTSVLVPIAGCCWLQLTIRILPPRKCSFCAMNTTAL